MCCDMINIVVETQAYSLNGVKLLLGDIFNLVNSQGKNSPEILMIPNKYEDRTVISGEAMSILSGSYFDYLKPDFAVRRSEDFNIASKISKPLAFFCRYNSLAFEDIVEMLRYIIQRSCDKRQ
jgi:chromosome partitioning protein